MVAFLVMFSMFATFFFITLYMQNIERLSPLETGVRFLPMTVLIILTAPFAGRLSDRYGSRWLLTGGMTLIAASLALESRITDTSGYLTLLPAFLVGGVGMGMTMSPMTAAVMSSVDRTKAGAASGVLSMTRMIGGVFGVASLTALFEHLVDRPRGGRPLAADVFIYSLSHSLRYSAAIALLGAFVAAAFIRSHPRRGRGARHGAGSGRACARDGLDDLALDGRLGHHRAPPVLDPAELPDRDRRGPHEHEQARRCRSRASRSRGCSACPTRRRTARA